MTKGTALAHSQHRRLLTLVIGAALALSGCGAQQPGAAAIVNDTIIRDQDVQTVASEVNKVAKVSVNDVLVSLILAPYVLAEAERTGRTVSDAQARKVIAKVSEPSAPTITFVRMQLAVQQLDEASQGAIIAALGKAKVTVNPRYGTFDSKKVELTATSANWFVKAGATAPTPSG